MLWPNCFEEIDRVSENYFVVFVVYIPTKQENLVKYVEYIQPKQCSQIEYFQDL